MYSKTFKESQIPQLTYSSCKSDKVIDFNLSLISICVFFCTSVVGMSYVQIQAHQQPTVSLKVYLTEFLHLN